MITICFIIFAIVLCYLIYNFNIDSQDQKQFDDMAQTITIEDNTDENADNNSGITDLINQNPDCIGWLRISGTKIDYPVMQTKENPQYYLRRDFNKQYSYLGTPFLDSRCDANYDSNLIVYGHNMKDGKMFADLLKYREISTIINFDFANEELIYSIDSELRVYDLEDVSEVYAKANQNNGLCTATRKNIFYENILGKEIDCSTESDEEESPSMNM